jgi:hypothetical protein
MAGPLKNRRFPCSLRELGKPLWAGSARNGFGAGIAFAAYAWLGAGLLRGLLLGLVMGLLMDPLHAQRSPAGIFLNTDPSVKYVGSDACSGCHQELYSDYKKTAMGRSMSPVDEGLQQALAPEPAAVENQKMNRRFRVYSQDKKIFQGMEELAPSEKPPFTNTHELAYVVGSGVNGYTFIVRRGDHLFQAPLSYYSRQEKWALSPGYEFADYGFNRAIDPACLACHSGRTRPVAKRGGAYHDPPFEELAIGCENCHGPGQLHVDKRLKSAQGPGDDPSIVNPAKLPNRLAENICMNCHQGGDARVYQPEKSHNDFRPGKYLNDTVAILKLPMNSDAAEHADLLEHHTSMALSKCFRATKGELGCLSCHAIHDQPAADSKVSYYREKCLQCHTDLDCGAPLESRASRSPANDCAGCHMPKRDIDVIAHSALTNHRIPVRPGQPFPDEAFAQTFPDLPELVHVNRPAGAGAESLPLLVRFRAFGELLAKRPDLTERYKALLAEAAEKHPNDPLVLASLGRKAKLEGTPDGNERAVEYLTLAIEAGSATSSTFEDLADVLTVMGRNDESAEALKRGVDVSPFSPKLLKMLTLKHINLKRYEEAATSMKRYVELFPEDDLMRGLLRQVAPGSR